MSKKNKSRRLPIAEANVAMMGKPFKDGLFPSSGRAAAAALGNARRVPGQHIHHPFPVKHGGTNHTANLESIPAAENLAIGSRIDAGRLVKNAAKGNVVAAAVSGVVSFGIAKHGGASTQEAAAQGAKDAGKSFMIGTALTVAMATPLAPVASLYIAGSTLLGVAQLLGLKRK